MAFPEDLGLALPYLDRKVLAVLFSNNIILQEIPATVIIDIEDEFPSGPWNEGEENAVIGDYSPRAFATYTGHETFLPPLPPASPSKIFLRIRQLQRLVVGQMRALRRRSFVQLFRLVVAQTRALHREGFTSRLIVLKKKLRRMLTE